MNSLMNGWFVNMTPAFKAGIRLIGIPNAGGGPALFRTWSNDLPPEIGVYPALLPGQGSRLREQPPIHIQTMVRDLGVALEPYLNEPFALFGYSMGALVAFELARYLRQHGRPQPLYLFVAARRAPHVLDAAPPLHELPDGSFLRGMQARYGGIPQAILQDAEMLAAFTPVLRANFTMIETYHYADAPPLDIPIVAFGGTRDLTTNETDLMAWGDQTHRSFAHHIYPGDHFFIQQHQHAVMEVIRQTLSPFLI